MTLTVDRLKELLHYDPETGLWTWLVTLNARGKKGYEAGCRRKDGRMVIRIDYRLYLGSRLAVLWMTGSWPKNYVDHRDCDPTNDKWSNLREATHSQNNMNSRTRRSETGIKGVRWHKQNKNWTADIKFNGKRRHLGSFECPAAAHLAYVLAASKAFGEFARAG